MQALAHQEKCNIKTKIRSKLSTRFELKKPFVNNTLNLFSIYKNIYLPNNLHESDDENDDKH